MMKTIPTALAVAAIFSAIGAVIYLVACIVHLIRTAKQCRKEQEDTSSADPALQRMAAVRFVYDYDFCETVGELQETIRHINEQRFILVSVVHDGEVYTVFFRRMLNG